MREQQTPVIIWLGSKIFIEGPIKLCAYSAEILYDNLIASKNTKQKIRSKQLKSKKKTKKKKALGVNTRSGKVVYFKMIRTQRHTILIGSSGYGKTNTIILIIIDRLEQGLPVIFFDPKADFQAMSEFIKVCHEYGNEPLVFSETYPNSIKINPLRNGSVNQIKDRIMEAFVWTEEYYRDVASSTLTQIIWELKNENVPVSLRSIYDLLVLKYDNKDTAGLKAKLGSIIFSDFGPLLEESENTYTIDDVRRLGLCLYIGLSTQGYGETARAVGKMITGDLIYHSYKTLTQDMISHGEELKPLSVIFDEFGSILTPRFIELLNKCRGAKIELTMAVQSVSDLDIYGRTLANQIMENCSNWIILKQRLAENASMLAESIGTYTTAKETKVIERGSETENGSVREVHELLVHPNIIKNLRVGQCILLQQDPFSVMHINIRKADI